MSNQNPLVSVWRSADLAHFYAPAKSHPSAENLIEFRRKEKMLFQDDFPTLYKSVLLEDLVLKALYQESLGTGY